MERNSTPERSRAALMLIAITCAATLLIMGALLLPSGTEAAGPTGDKGQYRNLLPLIFYTSASRARRRHRGRAGPR